MTEKPELLSPRGALPGNVEPYRIIGPLDQESLPAGLKATHSLKPDVWGLLELSEGRISFCWEDGAGGRQDLEAPAALVIAPATPHHLETDGSFRLTVTFLR